MGNETKTSLISKVKNAVNLAKEYWHVPPKGNYIPYKEIAALSGAGFGVHWATLLASTIGLNASNITQAKYYRHYEELEEMYFALPSVQQN